MSVEMCHKLPIGSCPICGHDSFIVIESHTDAYLTNGDGEIVDWDEIRYLCEGICCNCKHKFEMLASSERFIPMTPLRKLLYCYEKIDVDKFVHNSHNPMDVN